MIKLERCHDIERMKSVFTHPDIWATIAEDGQSVDDFHPDTKSQLYLAALSGSELIGYFAIFMRNPVELEAHIQILPEHRKKHALASGKAFLEWFYRDAPTRFIKLTTQVAFKYPNVKNFCTSFGLKVEGVNRQSCVKDGQIYDRWHLGITRAEAGEIVCQQQQR